MNEELRKFWHEKQLLDELTKIAKALHRLDEASCNYGLTPRQEKRTEKLEKRAEEIARELGYSSYFTQEEKDAKHLSECIPIY